MCASLLPLQAPFQLQLTAPTGLAALSNTQEVSKQDVGSGRTRRVFAPTPPMSIYLFAMVRHVLDLHAQCCAVLSCAHTACSAAFLCVSHVVRNPPTWP
jgi:hypothetical protein